jgi:TRAP-type C4-dicarboxylate transport system substrate-binding protein
MLLKRSAIGAASVLSSRWAGAAASAKVLRYSDHEPLGGMRTRFLKDVLFPAIEREAEGRLKIEAHWNGEVAIAYDALAAVGERRTTDLATLVPEYFAEKMPMHQLFKSFPTGPAGQQQVEFFRRVYAQAPGFAKELQANDTVEIFLGTGYPVAFFSREPLTALPNIRGEKWRSASFWHQDFLRNAGATPVSMHWGPAIYDALKAKSLDGLMVNVDSGYMLNVHEAAPHVLVSRDLWLGHLYVVAMNKSTWNGLPQEDQDAIRRAATSAYATLGSVMDRHLDEQINQLKAEGVQVRTLGHTEVEQWATLTQYTRVQDAWVAAQQAKGVEHLDGGLATCRALMREASKLR